jgi:hypothetical protein
MIYIDKKYRYIFREKSPLPFKFRTKRSRNRNVVSVKRRVDLGWWEFGMRRG